MTSAPRGMAPREGLELVLTKMGRTGPLLELRCRPQAGKSRYPRSQNTDSPCTSRRSEEILWDDTSMSLALGGEEVCGGASPSIISGGKSPNEEDC